jgi:acyl-CoA reductase-like NAD-dependent aldehyde dehydrogenase
MTLMSSPVPMLASVDPRTGATLRMVPQADRRTLERAIERLADGSALEALSDRRVRARLLAEIAEGLRSSRDLLIVTCSAESGLSNARLEAEFERTCRQLEAFSGVAASGHFVEAIIDTRDGSSVPPRPDLRRMKIPVGPVAVFTASNFPFAFGVAGGDTASALAAGCPVVVKGHPAHPSTSASLAEVVSAAATAQSLPEGVFQHLLTSDVALAQALVEEPIIQAVAFTGSHAGGRSIFDLAARRSQPIPVFAEMGSANPIVITRGALSARAEVIAQGVAESVANHAGQLCTKPGVVLCPEGRDSEAFLHELSGLLSGSQPSPMLSQRMWASFQDAVSDLTTRGLRLLTAAAPESKDGGYWQAPLAFGVDAETALTDPSVLDECFGPMTVCVSYRDGDDVERLLDSMGGQLTGTLHCESDDAEAPDILSHLSRIAGRVLVNDFPTGVAVSFATQHGGPYPATSAPSSTSVGMTAISRFLRPVCYQAVPQGLLPPELRDDNPARLWRLVDGRLSDQSLA